MDYAGGSCNSHNSIVGNMNNNSVKFVISHTLRKLPREEQVTRTVNLDRDGLNHTCTLTHDWKVFLDVVEGDPRPIIACVEADFGSNFLRQRHYVWNRPRRIRSPKTAHSDEESDTVWRCFESRQICAGNPPLQILIVGMGGTKLPVKYHPDPEPLEGYFVEKRIPAFGAADGSPFLRPIPLPPLRAFSIEQLPVPAVGVDEGSNMLKLGPCIPKNVRWHRGEDGVINIQGSLVTQNDHNATMRSSKMVNNIISIKLFSDTPNERNLQNMIKLSQNFIKYEDAIDKIIHMNRESRAREEDCQFPLHSVLSIASNKCGVDGDTNRERHDTLASCSNNISELVEAMNPNKNERYKLMFVREEDTQMLSAQFSFEALPPDVDFTVTLLRFCMLFVHNSFRLQKPNPFRANRSIESEIDFLFSVVVRDRFVEEKLWVGEERTHKEDDHSQLSSFDIDMIEIDDMSIPESISRDKIKEDDFSDSLDSGDGWLPDRKRDLFEKEARGISKRPRPLTPTTSHAIQHKSFDFSNPESQGCDVVFRSDLQSFTAEKLKTLCKTLCTGISNKKSVRLERLKAYFDARDDELKTYVEKDNHNCNEKILGIEFIFKDDTKRDANNIYVIMRGGKQMKIRRTSVCQSKCNEQEFSVFPQLTSEDEAKFLFEKLYRKERMETYLKNYIGKIDELINDLENNERLKTNPCRFVLIHNLFWERDRET